MADERSLNPEPQDKTTSLPADASKPTVSLDQTGTHEAGQAKPVVRTVSRRDLPQHPDYEITSEIARGGMGRVLAGREIALDREVAIKTLLPGANTARFITEARITAKLPHPGIPPVHALGELADGAPFLAMKLVGGVTLAKALNSRADLSVELPLFTQIFQQIAQAVGFAHAQEIIHRDLKPANVMVGDFGEVHVMDWGLACDKKANSQHASNEIQVSESDFGSGEIHRTRQGTIFGTPSYMAPEQARGERVDARADVFALGGILPAILTGQPPFRGDTAIATIELAAAGDTTDIIARLSECGADKELIEIAKHCLQPAPDDRPANGEEVADLIANYRAGVERRLRQAEADRAASEAKNAEQQKRRKVVRIAAGVVILVLVAGVIGTSIGLVNANTAWEAESKRADSELQAKLDMKKEYDRAEAALTDVRRSIDRYVDVVENEELLKDPRFKDVIPKLLAEALDQYERYIEDYGDSQVAEVRANVANTLWRIGYIHEVSGSTPDGIRALGRCVAMYDALASEYPEKTEYRIDLAGSLNGIGRLYDMSGQTRSALAAYERGLDIRERLSYEIPLDVENQRELAALHTNIAVLHYGAGQTDKVRISYDRATELLQSLVRDNPLDIESQDILATNHNNIAALHYRHGQIDEALTAFKQALRIQEAIAAEEPSLPEFRIGLATTYNNVGAAEHELGLVHEALASFRQALRIHEAIAAENPSVIEYQSGLATSHRNVGAQLSALGRVEDSLIAFEEALRIQTLIAADHPSVIEHQQDLAACYYNVGSDRAKLGRADEALTAYEEALRIQKLIAAGGPSVIENQIELVSTYNAIGAAYRRKEQFDQALDAQLQALEIQELLVRENPSVTDYEFKLAKYIVDLGSTYGRMGKTEQALAAYQSALAIQERLRPDFPMDVEYQIAPSNTCSDIGTVLLDMDQPDEALAAFNRGVRICERLAAENPSVTEYQRGLANGYNNIGIARYKMGQLDDSLAAYNSALEIRQPLADDNPTKTDYHIDVAKSHINIGLFYEYTGQPHEALAAFNQAWEILDSLAPEIPNSTTVRQRQFDARFYRARVHESLSDWQSAAEDIAAAIEFETGDQQTWLRTKHARVLALAGDHVASVREAEMIVLDTDESANERTSTATIAAARAFALAIAAAGNDKNLTESERAKLQEQYAARAVEVLAIVAESGYFGTPENRELLETDSDLDALRDRADFKDLVDSLDKVLAPTA